MQTLIAMLFVCLIGSWCEQQPRDAGPAQPAISDAERSMIESNIRKHLHLAAAAPLGPAEFARVTELDLNGDAITDAGVAWLASPITGLQGLTCLRLGNTAITDAGVQAIARDDTGLKALTTLELFGTAVTDWV